MTFITHNCGKTTVVQSMIGMCDDLGLTYTLIAPTGSASMRLSEQTHRYASTAHLKCLKDGEIHTDVLIIDECSMASLDIFKMVIDCITNDNIRVILIGDNAQLTSISCGTVFADIIESGYVPNAKLTKVFRYGDSGILYSATNERQGRYFLDDENVKFNGEDTYSILNNYKFITRSEDETIIDTALIQYNKLLTKYKPKDILILTGYNVGACGTITINNKIQSEVNPPKPNEEVLEKRFRGVKMLFRVGDRIINIKNNYNALPLDAYREIQNSNGMLSADDFDLDTVYNGQRGVVIGIENGHIICKFDNQEIVYDKLETNTYLLLAYAITIHKSQGQESKAVITLYSPNQKRVMNRNLLYVGDTRAKELQIDVGDLTTFKSALGVDEVLARNTWTKDLLVSYYENN
jgi:ATP-dependent exoDNAse (exonuclease V) alpha subunit